MYFLHTINYLCLVLCLIYKSTVLGDIISTVHGEFCYSSNDTEGRCVAFTECQPLLNILKERPLSKADLKLIVNLTCIFDLYTPLICCPTKDIVLIPNELKNRKREKVTNLTTNDISYNNHRNFKLMPSFSECSIQKGEDNFKARQKTARGEFPWMALIGYLSPTTEAIEFLCGGTVINKRYILTAAHCAVSTGGLTPGKKLTVRSQNDVKGILGPLDIRHNASSPTISNNMERNDNNDTLMYGNTNESRKVIRLAEHDLINDPDCSNVLGRNRVECSYAKDMLVEKVIPHPKFDFLNSSYVQNNDVALIRTSEDIIFNDFVRPVCLPFVADYKLHSFPENLNSSEVSFTAGWGKVSRSLYGNTIMQVVPMPIKPKEDCSVFQFTPNELTGEQICAGGDQGSCGGDSGGPLMILVGQKYSASKLFQVGVTSFGPLFCSHSIPHIYTSLASQLQWILDSIEP